MAEPKYVQDGHSIKTAARRLKVYGVHPDIQRRLQSN